MGCLGLGLGLGSCGGGPGSLDRNPSPEALGTLEIRANGEAFVRDGLTSKDGWDLHFDQVLVTLAGITAYQTDPPFDARATEDPQIQVARSLPDVVTVNLVPDPGEDDRPLVGHLEVPVGHYNALAWQLVPAPTGEAQGYAIRLTGVATRRDGGKTSPGSTPLSFEINLQAAYDFLCGEYVGEQRQGFVAPSQPGTLEATLHFDHLFGDAELGPNDDLNQNALGFEPLAKLAGDQPRIQVTSDDLKTQFNPSDYQRLLDILPNLGHVGEGHCRSLPSPSP